MSSMTNSLDAVLRRYGIQDHLTYRSSDGGFHKSWAISSKKGRFFLKSRPKQAERRALTDCEFSEYLNAAGIETAKPQHNVEGDYVTREGNMAFALFEYVDGTGYEDNSHHLTSAAKTLSRLHRVGRNYNGVTAFSKSGIEWAEEWTDDFERSTKTYRLRQYLADAAKAVRSVERRMPATSIHWDFHGGNMKFRNDVCIPFDFEFLHRDHSILDIANSLICLTALDQKKLDYSDAETFIQECEIDVKKAEIFLRAYGEDNKLQKDEICVLPDALQVAWIGWSAYTFSNLRCGENTKEKATYFPVWVKDNRKDIVDLGDVICITS